ncbi:MAG: hypothetical protein IKL04_02505 [Lachnospiraceae bacterium]|nr:hypothetical protein [Lachnospiraceae bacterium]
MNNIVKSQLILCKKYWLSVMASVLIPIVLFVLLFGVPELIEENKNVLGVYGFTATLIVLIGVTFVISFGYMQRIQMYEIMAGKKPHQIILGRMCAFLPITLVFLVILTPFYWIWLPGMEHTLFLFWVICIRMTLVTIFLSPILKEATFGVPLSSIIIMFSYGSYGTESYSHSAFSWLGFGQCILLGEEITDTFIIKVICSGVIACVICYIIGHITLKKKIDLEPHQL